MALIRGISRGSQVLLITTLVMVGLGLLSFFQSGPESGAPAYRAPAFDLQGHRGYRGLYPENTLPAVEAALAVGVTTLELDVQMTADGRLVVHHDTRLSPQHTRTRDGQGPPIGELTLVEVQSFDVGSAHAESDTAQRFPRQVRLEGVAVPSLEQVIDLAERRTKGAIHYNLETKIAPDDPDSAEPKAMVEALLALMQRKGIGLRTSVQSFDWRSLGLVQEAEAEVPTVYLTAERRWLNNVQRGRPGASPWTAGLDIDALDGSVPRAIKQAGGAVWAPYYRDLRPAELHEARRLGLRVIVWTVNDPADMASLIDLGVDGIITDYPGRLREVLEEKGKPLPPRFPGSG